MPIDFGKLSRPKSGSAPTNPLEIFKKTPNLGNAPNDLWKGQADALTLWNDARDRDDNIIILNTGAGKSIVGVLVAQSLHNEGVGPVVYACSTIDLVQQTARECDRIGIQYSTRVASTFSNDLFETGQAFCVTTYQALFAGRSTFTNEKRPAAIIFDDAHVSERLIKDAFTLSVQRKTHDALYKELLRIIRPEFAAIDREQHLNFTLEDVGLGRTTMCPPITGFNRAAEIIAALKAYGYQKHNELLFPVLHLYEHLSVCAILVSAGAIEITPPFVPTGQFEFLGKGIRRVYLSATLDYDTDFVRAFGITSANRIEPNNDAGNGERLILLSSGFSAEDEPKALAADLAKKQKVLVTVPSYVKAKRWEDMVAPPEPKDFSASLDAFRKASRGLFCLVSRIDGIDLPQDTCRIMLVDGAPSGASLLETYQFESLGLANLFSTKLASRVTQLFGRINRGRSDFGAFLVYGRDLNNWLKNERNKALLPELLRKQVILGQSFQADMGKMDRSTVIDAVDSLLGRNQGWLDFYRDTIDGLEVSNEAIVRVKDREAHLAKAAAAECAFMSKLWEGDYDGARAALIDHLNDVAIADAKLAGWYSIWLGMTYEAQGDLPSRDMHYQRARSRLNKWVNLPRRARYQIAHKDVVPSSALHERLLAVNEQGAQALGDYVSRLRSQAAVLEDASKSSAQHEETFRSLGEILGFDASRPDNEYGIGPDVLWQDSTIHYQIPFELKTKKATPAEYTKDEIGQSLNHLQWVAANAEGNGGDGILLVGPEGVCKDNASPAEEMHFTTPKRVSDLIHEFAAKVDSARNRPAEDRTATLDDLGQQTEWQLPGWFARMRLKSLKEMKVS